MKPLSKKTLDLFKESLLITRTGKGNSYNNFGTLNQAAWIGENSECLIAEIERLYNHRKVLLEACQQAVFAIPTTHGAFETVRKAIKFSLGDDANASA